MIVANGFAINASIYRKLPYNPERDFAPVSLVSYGGYVLVVHPSLAARNVNELITLAKASPGKLTNSSRSPRAPSTSTVPNLAVAGGEFAFTLYWLA